LAALEFGAHRFQARAQDRKVFLPGCTMRRERGEQQGRHQKKDRRWR
jgi:hypothetical protein